MTGFRGSRRDVTAFATAHPSVPAFYLLVTLAFTMSAMQPVLIGISLAGALAYGVAARGWRSCVAALRWQLPVILIIAVLNPLFSAAGSTELFRIGPRAVYLESLAYGCSMGGLFVASVLWFQAASSMLPFDRVMALAGNVAPVIALMVSMCMRMIPRFVRQGRAILAAQDTALAAGDGGALDATRARLRTATVLMGWTMEDSLETADAMRARGWSAARRRTTYTRFHFTSADAARLAALAIGAVAVGFLAWVAASQYRYYPVMSGLVLWWGYAPYAAWMLVPAILHAIAERRFS